MLYTVTSLIREMQNRVTDHNMARIENIPILDHTVSRIAVVIFSNI
jgi:hypothetical protein